MNDFLESTRASYDALANEYAARLFRELDSKPLDRALLNRFAEEVEPLGIAVDMGCGPGHVARYLYERGLIYPCPKTNQILSSRAKMTRSIPVIETYGTHYEVGHQIGTAARDVLHAMYAESRADFGESWAAMLQDAIPFYEATHARLPRVVEEVRGCADGAQLPFADLFLMGVEELYCGEVCAVGPDRPQSAGKIERERSKGCSDLAAAPPATADGHVWLAHNNDLGISARDQLFVTRLRVIGEPEIVGVTVGGLFISIGLNDAGIALTGNQVNANDSRIGVPRLFIVRDLLAQTSLERALDSALNDERASSYNNIIASRDGRIVNAEGSATAAALTWGEPGGGTLAHTNHYLAPEMRDFEADPDHIAMSASRCSRAYDYATKYRGQINYEICHRFVSDHVYAPWSVCKHAGQSVTVFSAIIDLTETRMWLTSGNPCQHEFVEYPVPHSAECVAVPVTSAAL